MVRKFNLAATAMIALALVTGACSSLLESQAPPECEGGKYIQNLSIVPRSDGRAVELKTYYIVTNNYVIPSDPPVTVVTTEEYNGLGIYTVNDRHFEDEHWEQITQLGEPKFDYGYSLSDAGFQLLQNKEFEICVKGGILFVRGIESGNRAPESVYSGSKENR